MESLNSVGHAVSNDKSNLDAGCKALLGCKAIAAFVVKSCIAEFEGMSVDEIANRIVGTPEIGLHNVDDLPERIDEKNVESKSVNEGTLYYDVLFDIRLPDNNKAKVIIDIEAQNNYYPGYPLLTRAVFYCGRLLSSQKETVFHNSQYGKIRKVYSIWLCISPNEKASGVINRYELAEECLTKEYHFPKQQYDKLCVVMACLGDITSDNDLVRLFSTVYSSDVPIAEKLETVRNCGIKVTNNIRQGVDSMCNYSDLVEAKGIKKGVEQGRIEATVKNIESLMRSLNLTLDKALDTLGVPEDIRSEVSKRVTVALENK